MAWINLDTNVIFIHVPKTGGNSMSMSKLVNGFGTHETARKVKIFMDHHIGGVKYWDFFKFGFVRNPWDRLVSIHFFESQRVQNKKHYWPKSFEDFIFWLDKRKMKETVLKPQYEYLYRKRKLMVDFVGKFEHIERDWKEVCKRAEVPYEVLIHNNKSVYAPYKEYYTPRMIERVRKLYKKDTELFGYTY